MWFRVCLLACLGLATAPKYGAWARDSAVREYLDQSTAVTIVVVSKPFVFARERSDLAVNARDYLSLTPLQVNRSGDRHLYWFGFRWSTIGSRNREPPVKDGVEYVLLADGRPIALRPVGRSLREVGIGELPLRSPSRHATPVLFAADAEILNYAAAATEVSVHLIYEDQNEAFELWRDARHTVREFLDELATGTR
jgi:hypothetical protein